MRRASKQTANGQRVDKSVQDSAESKGLAAQLSIRLRIEIDQSTCFSAVLLVKRLSDTGSSASSSVMDADV